MKRASTQPTLVADLQGGERVRCADGECYRIGHITWAVHGDGKRRWARLLRPDLSETDRIVYLSPNIAVLEVMPETRKAVGGREVDPLRGEG